ncbi:putative nucleotidyltransferase substrate binding domain-containing protein [Bradyrhizobium acaciae]|uniref:putative nucleotidyltransferase substrate binding domain-containing protein n=1 Tax=Bradyrhizobium acaciae TaxID=2683706 RepID=UPI001E453064|nr:putative nucleotidyltransferase substrate binding domain-containing protein [Bradyrhizobium acaciae]MCC8978274.1 cyclic nucleotide-binding domain-containing protein [Bradyrhizobium acaciae]
MPKAFDISNAPYDRLAPGEAEMLRASLDVAYFRPGEVILGKGVPADALHVIIKGTVEERDAAGLVALLGHTDTFDSRALVHDQNGHTFLARDETLCYTIPRKVALDLIRSNPRFAAFFYREISQKLDELANDEEAKRYGSLMYAKVGELFLHPPAFIAVEDTIETAGHLMRQIDSNALFVRDGERVGIITGMSLSKAVVLRRESTQIPVGLLASFDIVSVRRDDFVSSALLLMTKHNKRRLAVKDGEQFVGILEEIDLLGFLAGSAQVTAGRIDRALNQRDLAVAAREIEAQTRALRRQGVKVEVIAEIVSDLNRRLLSRLFEMVAPHELRSGSCLIVMGSEGRGEQTMRTDQDNGLILSAPVDAGTLEAFRGAFSGALRSFGFPPCPGNVMVSNPAWSRPLPEYLADFRRWVALPDETAHMNVAIIYDAQAIAGNAQLLDGAKAELIDLIRGEQAFLAHFARAIDAFETPIGLFNQLITSEGSGDALDLKKGGIFPIVHGVRSLALEQGLREASTDQRISRLCELGVLRAEFGRDLKQAFRFLLMLRLDGQLAASAGTSGTLVRPAHLSSMERHLLRDALQVVKQFREMIRHHFKLTMF